MSCNPNRVRKAYAFFLACLVGLSLPISVFAALEEDEANFVKPTIEYDEIIDPGQRRAGSSLMGSQFATRADRTERAIQLARRAMKRDPDDLEIHKALAEALEQKLEKQADKDPKLYNECVKEWLVVLRNGVGMEKGVNFKGIGMDSLYGDDEYHGVAKQRLKHLTGYAPKLWETNNKYLTRVLRPAETSITGTILNPRATRDSAGLHRSDASAN